MITTQKMMAMFTETADAFVEEMVAGSCDFAEDYQLFQEAINYLEASLGEEANSSVDDLVDAIHRQTISNWLFSSYLGFQANLDHFINPVARTFADVDPEIYLRESVAKALPEYASAQAIIDSFWRQLTPEQEEVFEAVSAYIAHLETVVPKMAHYYGFLLGNELLPRVVPSYQPDMQLTVHYCRMIKDYFLKDLKLIIQQIV